VELEPLELLISVIVSTEVGILTMKSGSTALEPLVVM